MKVNDIYGEGGEPAPAITPEVATEMIDIKLPKLT